MEQELAQIVADADGRSPDVLVLEGFPQTAEQARVFEAKAGAG